MMHGFNVVSARELHDALGVGRDFTTWIKGRISKYEFEENVDFTTVWNDTRTGDVVEYNGNSNSMVKLGYSVDYAITVDMAKELCMVENNEKGRIIRKYFIECEKQLSQISRKDRLLLDIVNSKGSYERAIAVKAYEEYIQETEIKPLENKIEEQRPSVDMCYKRRSSEGLLSITDVTKLYDLKQGQLTTWAKSKGYIHATRKEVNKLGDDFFRVYGEEYPSIGITEKGLQLIDKNIDDIKECSCRFKKQK